MRLGGAVTLLLIFGMGVSGCPTEPVVQTDITYCTGSGEDLKLDLFSPGSPGLNAFPAIVLIHGGGWVNGSKEEFHGEARLLASRGFAVATVNYRLAPKHRFPAAVEDVKCAIRWLRANSAKHGIDPDRIAAMGASAGGHLALMAGLTDAADGFEGAGGFAEQSSRVRAVVNWSGPTDLMRAQARDEVLRHISEQFLGATIQQSEELYRRASPVTYITPDDPAVLTVHGDTDDIVPYHQALSLNAGLEHTSLPHTLLTFPGAGHDFLNDSNRNKTTQEATLAFLKSWLSDIAPSLDGRGR